MPGDILLIQNLFIMKTPNKNTSEKIQSLIDEFFEFNTAEFTRNNLLEIFNFAISGIPTTTGLDDSLLNLRQVITLIEKLEQCKTPEEIDIEKAA
jgi:hypothetical protein